MRPSEYAKSRFATNLLLKQIKFHPSINYPNTLIIELYNSKMNKYGKKELIIMDCTCKKRILGVWCPCPVHHTKYYINIRNKYFKYSKESYLLIKNNGKPVTYDNINNFLKNCIKFINNKYKLKFDAKEYTPHSLRVGGCTDLSRLQKPGYYIEQSGRWSSKTWKTTYINLDWRDISTLSGVPINQLRCCNPLPFTDV